MSNLSTIFLSALISSSLTYFFGIRHLKTETEIKMKAEKYNNLIKYLHGFVGNDANKTDIGGDLKKKFFKNGKLRGYIVLMKCLQR